MTRPLLLYDYVYTVHFFIFLFTVVFITCGGIQTEAVVQRPIFIDSGMSAPKMAEGSRD